ncbi:MAG: metal ABC transporter substrate-binding protein [bacterium]
MTAPRTIVLAALLLAPPAGETTASPPDGGPAPGAAPIQVVSTIPDFAAVARQIGGDLVEARAIALGNQDPHFVLPKPSFALMLRRADLFITTGLDLEMWAPTLIDKARNRSIVEGSDGYIAVSAGVDLMDVPTQGVDRSSGEIHVYGNPHFHTSPVEIKQVAWNITLGLQRVDPANEDAYQEGLEDFRTRIDEAFYGPELAAAADPEELDARVRDRTLIDYLEQTEVEGRPLIDRLGGWLKEAMPMRGHRIIAYHKNWNYFARDFGLQVVEYVEPKPGIPPSARHVKHIIDEIERLGIPLMLVANYFEKDTPMKIQERTGVSAVMLPLSVTGEEGVETLFDLYDLWVDRVLEALAERETDEADGKGPIR